MRFSEIKLLEDVPPNVRQIWENEVIPNCSYIYNLYRNNIKNITHIDDIVAGTFLFRGVKRYNNEIFYGQSRENRRPVDSPTLVHDQLSLAMLSAGLKATRSNSIFTSSALGTAHGYGAIKYVIFPVNGFNYTWSRKYRDLAEFTLSSRDLNLFGFEEFGEIRSRARKIYTTFFTLQKKIQPLSEDLDDALRALMHWSDYLRFAHNLKDTYQRNINLDILKKTIEAAHPLFDQIADKNMKNIALKTLANFSILAKRYIQVITSYGEKGSMPMSPGRMNRVIKHIEFTNTDLEEAIKRKHEVMINGSYYAVSTDMFLLDRRNNYSIPDISAPSIEKNLKELFHL